MLTGKPLCRILGESPEISVTVRVIAITARDRDGRVSFRDDAVRLLKCETITSCFLRSLLRKMHFLCHSLRTTRERGNAENLARFCHLTTPGNRFNRTIFIATRGNYGVGALIRHADSGRGTFSSVDRMIVCIQCAVAFGSWQFGAGGRERRNKLSESCRADEKSLSGRKRSGGLSPLFSLFLSVCFSHSFIIPCFLSHPLSPHVVPSGVEEGIISGNSTGIYGCARRIAQCILTYLNIVF